MKALLLMPLNEESQYFAMRLMVAFQHKNIEALSVPSYIDYLQTVKIAKTFEQALLMGLSTTNDFAQQENCVVIGNCDRSIKFDTILGVNINHEEGAVVEDLQLQKMREKYGTDQDVGPLINNLYAAADAEYYVGADAEKIVQLVIDLWGAKHSIYQNIIQNNRK